ncbi:MAG TPA: orotidine-5'-phosphate decarboxylase [Microbacteriaceae bacterium]|nr:orotidine-5'-phosphate decarboxylase [Microbacteriaceae bacterium]
MTEAPADGRRLASILAAGPALCLGIDPHATLLAAWDLPDSAEGLREFGLRAAEAARDARTPVVKPQVAFFERHGSAGIAALEDVIAAARAAGLWVIADAKRGDIGSTMVGYADAWLREGSALEADALTVTPYLGLGSLRPAVDSALAAGKSLFVLAATSNPEASSIQDAIGGDGGTVAGGILQGVNALNASIVGDGIGPIGVVIGATIRASDLGVDLAGATRTPILAPGFGAQGANLADIRAGFGPATDRIIANVSREALSAGPAGLPARLRELVDELAAGAAA